MWALRRAASSTRSQNFRILGAPTQLNGSDVLGSNLGNASHHGTERVYGCYMLRSVSNHNLFSSISCRQSQKFCSQAGGKSTVHGDEIDEGFSDLEIPPENSISAKTVEGEDDVLTSGATSDDELDLNEERISSKDSSPLLILKILLETPRVSINNALDKWVEEGNPMRKHEISIAIAGLKERRFYAKALQFAEWLDTKKLFDLEESDYASHLDLVAKVHGIYKAEKYLESIPESFRGELVYRTLLANFVLTTNTKKAEEVFKKIRDLGLPISSVACNQLILLYKKTDRKKIADVLTLMEKEDVKPSLLTYKLLIDVKGRAHDIPGMEAILETMKGDGIELDLAGKAMVARHYILGGCNEKAEAAAKELEGDIQENRSACRFLLPLYADLGKSDDVARVWKVCEADPRTAECFGALEAWGKLGRVSDAEEVFEKMIKTSKKSSKPYIALLKVYTDHKLLTKGKDLVKRMSDSGCMIDPRSLDALVKLYVRAGDVEKAESILQKAAQQNQIRPLFVTYVAVLESYTKKGDIHNSEKMFHRLKQARYVPRAALFQQLLQAYVVAKAPAYGFRERMKADHVYPSKTVLAQLAAIDTFKKTPVSDLLD